MKNRYSDQILKFGISWAVRQINVNVLDHTILSRLQCEKLPSAKNYRNIAVFDEIFNWELLKDIFESVDNQNIIGFIKDTHFYHKHYCR